MVFFKGEKCYAFLFNLSWIKGCQHNEIESVTWASKYFRNVTKIVSPSKTVKACSFL